MTELEEIKERFIKLETTIKIELRHIKNELREMRTSIQKLNEEYGRLAEQYAQLEAQYVDLESKFKESLMTWKFIAVIVSPLLAVLLKFLLP